MVERMKRGKQNTESLIKETCWSCGGFWVPFQGLYCCSSLFCYGSFVELASADKPASDAHLDISEDGLTDHTLT